MSFAVALSQVRDEKRFGRKAVGLGAARRARLPVPSGFALPVDLLEALAEREPAAEQALRSCVLALDGPVALRASCVADEGALGRFTGIRATALNVVTPHGALEAARAVFEAMHGRSARVYRRARGLSEAPRVGLVVQSLVDARCGGLLFTHDPDSHAGERRVEAIWGLGSGIASGLAEPDRVRLAPDGAVLERRTGTKRRRIRLLLQGGSEEASVRESAVRAPCLDDSALEALAALAERSEAVFGGALRLEWALGLDGLWLLGHHALETA